jgi:hypothetical protein
MFLRLNYKCFYKFLRIRKINKLFIQTSRALEQLEDKIRSNHRIGSLKIRTTGKITQIIWKRVDFIEFDRQWSYQPDQSLAEKKIHLYFNPSPPISKKKSINSDGKGFFYCVYKCNNKENKKKLTLIKKKPLLNIPKNTQSKTIKALNILSNTLSCSKELKKLSTILDLYWGVNTKT